MKLREALVPFVAAGLYFFPGCAGPSQTEQAEVTHFDHTVTTLIKERNWQEVRGEDSRPEEQEGEIRDVRSQIIEGKCIEVPDTYVVEDEYGVLQGQEDDDECQDLWECKTQEGDDNFCQKQPDETVYNYWQRTWVKLGSCTLDPRRFTEKNLKGREHTECVKTWQAQTPRDQRAYTTEEHNYFFWADIKNEDGTERSVQVSVDNASQWAGLALKGCVEVKGPERNKNDRYLVGAC